MTPMMRGIALCVVILVLLPALPAQTPTTGMLTGSVKDPSGALVAGARLAIASESGEERATNSGSDGMYRFPGSRPALTR